MGVVDPLVMFDNLLEEESRAEVDNIGFAALDLHACFLSDAPNAKGATPSSRSTRLWGLVRPMEVATFFERILIARFRMW